MTLSRKIDKYCSFFRIPSIFIKSPTLFALVHPQTIIDHPPCLTVDTTQSGIRSFLQVFQKHTVTTVKHFSTLQLTNFDIFLAHSGLFTLLCDLSNSFFYSHASTRTNLVQASPHLHQILNKQVSQYFWRGVYVRVHIVDPLPRFHHDQSQSGFSDISEHARSATISRQLGRTNCPITKTLVPLIFK